MSPAFPGQLTHIRWSEVMGGRLRSPEITWLGQELGKSLGTQIRSSDWLATPIHAPESDESTSSLRGTASHDPLPRLLSPGPNSSVRRCAPWINSERMARGAALPAA